MMIRMKQVIGYPFLVSGLNQHVPKNQRYGIKHTSPSSPIDDIVPHPGLRVSDPVMIVYLLWYSISAHIGDGSPDAYDVRWDFFISDTVIACPV